MQAELGSFWECTLSVSINAFLGTPARPAARAGMETRPSARTGFTGVSRVFGTCFAGRLKTKGIGQQAQRSLADVFYFLIAVVGHPLEFSIARCVIASVKLARTSCWPFFPSVASLCALTCSWRRGSDGGEGLREEAHMFFSGARVIPTRSRFARPRGRGLILTRLWLSTRCGWDSRAPGRRLLCACLETVLFHSKKPFCDGVGRVVCNFVRRKWPAHRELSKHLERERMFRHATAKYVASTLLYDDSIGN
jgi:hypothetical protein